MAFSYGGTAAECRTCGRSFTAKGDWQTQCPPCFFATTEGQAWLRRRQQEEAAQRQQANSQWENAQKARYDDAAQRNWNQYAGMGGREREYYNPPPRQAPPRAIGGLSKELLRKLIMLCHPDKHGSSKKMSTEVTQELLRMRKDCE